MSGLDHKGRDRETALLWAGSLIPAAILALILTLILAVTLLWAPRAAQARTVGLFVNQAEAYLGYTLFAPMGSDSTYLIDNQGREVHSWSSSSRTGSAVYLLDNGLLLRTCRADGAYFDAGGAGGGIELVDWGGAVLWRFTYSGPDHLAHHDVAYLENGNILFIAWERIDSAQALAAGRDPDLLDEGQLWPDMVLEVNPFGEIVWQWRVMDHLVQDRDPSLPGYGAPSANPQLIDINHVTRRAGADWTHLNSVAYNQGLDQVLLSVHGFNEVWIIDHSTTTEEAAGHSGGGCGRGGDLLYRWGNPAAHGAGSAADQHLFGQHDAQWIETGLPGGGDLLIFNNGQGRPGGDFSTVDQITPPQDGPGGYTLSGSAFGPEAAGWTYPADPVSDFYSQNISGAQRLQNGNTLVCQGTTGTFFEVTPEGETVWKYVNPVTGTGVLGRDESVPQGLGGQTNQVFKIRRYGLDYAGLEGQDLSPGEVIEK